LPKLFLILCFENRFSTGKIFYVIQLSTFYLFLNASFLLHYPALIKQIHLLDSVNFMWY